MAPHGVRRWACPAGPLPLRRDDVTDNPRDEFVPDGEAADDGGEAPLIPDDAAGDDDVVDAEIVDDESDKK